MRELTVRIRFAKASLGNVKVTRDRNGLDGIFEFLRNRQGFVTFLASWHKANMYWAAQLLGRHQSEVGNIHWDIQVDGVVARGRLHRRYYRSGKNGRKRYTLHEAFYAGQVVGIHCVVPAAISDDDFRRLMNLAGRYRGLSPYKPGENGFFEVEEVLPRRRNLEDGLPGEVNKAFQQGMKQCGP